MFVVFFLSSSEEDPSCFLLLFEQDCKLVIIACNTASAKALRKIQSEYLPAHYPDRKVLGVLVPLAEEALRSKGVRSVGVLATNSTVQSKAFVSELKKIRPDISVIQQAAPLLVTHIENGHWDVAKNILQTYLQPFIDSPVDCLILGCTHYALIRSEIEKLLPKTIKIISQEHALPGRFKNYIKRHKEIENVFSKDRTRQFYLTQLTPAFENQAKMLFGKEIVLKVVSL